MFVQCLTVQMPFLMTAQGPVTVRMRGTRYGFDLTSRSEVRIQNLRNHVS